MKKEEERPVALKKQHIFTKNYISEGTKIGLGLGLSIPILILLTVILYRFFTFERSQPADFFSDHPDFMDIIASSSSGGNMYRPHRRL